MVMNFHYWINGQLQLIITMCWGLHTESSQNNACFHCVLCSLQNKINATPQIIDFQELLKSVERLMKINQALKDGTVQVKKRRRRKNKKQKDGLINTKDLVGKDIMLPGMTREDKPIPSFVQEPGETDSHFLHRIDQACHVSFCLVLKLAMYIHCLCNCWTYVYHCRNVTAWFWNA